MRQSRFPPLLSGPSVAAAAIALVVGIALMFLVGLTPYGLVAVGHEGLGLMAALLLTILLFCVLAYRLTAPRMWAFTNRFANRVERPTLPADLVAPCLSAMDFKCPVCAYNWRGLDKSRCPECNTPVQLFIYTDRPPNAKWNGLVISWLAITLLASGLVTYSCTASVVQMLRYSGGPYASVGTLYWISLAFIALVGAFNFAVCLVLMIKALIPKSPDRRGLFVRRTVVWLAVLNAVSAVAVVLQVVSSMLLGMLW